MKTWECKIGEVDPGLLPDGSDLPMRRVVEAEYERLTGREAAFTFSGWGGSLTESERAVVENREPNHEPMIEELAHAIDTAYWESFVEEVGTNTNIWATNQRHREALIVAVRDAFYRGKLELS